MNGNGKGIPTRIWPATRKEVEKIGRDCKTWAEMVDKAVRRGLKK